MDNDSAVRRLDKTGRLVIPKRMRRALHWQSGDPIVLTLHAKSSLLLHRYPQLQALRTLAAGYADAFYATCTVPIALCDREHVLVSRGFGLPNGAPLSAAVQRMLTACHEPRSVVEAIQITQASPLQAAAFVPILSRDNVAGGLLIGQAHEPPGEGTLTAAALVTRMIAAQLL